MVSPRASSNQNNEEPYVRRRDHPYYKGLLNSNKELFTSKSPESTDTHKISRSISDMGHSSTKTTFESFAAQSSKVARTNSFAFSNGTRPDFEVQNNSTDPNNNHYGQLLGSQATEKTFVVDKRRVDLPSIALPQSAASFYSGVSPQFEVVELCQSTKRLNLYLKAKKDEIYAGVPGKFLHAVIGQDAAGVGSVASTLMYAFYLNETRSSDHLCTVPIINMKRIELSSHAELKWLLDSCQIDHESLIFIDEVDLPYYDLFGGLKIVLLNGHTLPAILEALKESVVEILLTRTSKGESTYPWVETVTETEDCSCCTFVAEKFALTSPETLVGKGLSRLLLAGILSDTLNLTNSIHSSKDKYMSTLLIHSAGRLGFNGLYQILRYKRHDLSDLTVIDILRKDFKQWERKGKSDNHVSKLMVSHIGMSSIGISLAQLLTHEGTAAQEIKYFQQLEKLRLLMIVSGYYDSKNNFKREILVSAESVDQMKNLLSFFNSNSANLPLKVLNQPGLREEMRAFEIDKVTSRKTIERLLEEYGGTSKA